MIHNSHSISFSIFCLLLTIIVQWKKANNFKEIKGKRLFPINAFLLFFIVILLNGFKEMETFFS